MVAHRDTSVLGRSRMLRTGRCSFLQALRRDRHTPHIARDLRLAFQGLGEVGGHLQAEPHVEGAAEGFGEAQGHFGGDASGAVDELAQGLAADAEGLAPSVTVRPVGSRQSSSSESPGGRKDTSIIEHVAGRLRHLGPASGGGRQAAGVNL